MERINKISKGLTKAANIDSPAVPSLAGTAININYKEVPTLQNFLKSQLVTDIDTRKAGKYKLRKFETEEKIKPGSRNTKHLVLTYKLGNTKYKITSCTKIVQSRTPLKVIEGNIKISKSLFNKKVFELKDLPHNIVDSINENIKLFNGTYVLKLGEIELKKRDANHKKESNFFEGLDI